MHGVKVYLKSGRDRLYKAMVALAGLALILAAFLHLDSKPLLWMETTFFGVCGISLLIHTLLKPRVQRRTRYLPSLLLFVASGFLLWSFFATNSLKHILPPALSLSIGVFSAVLAVAGPMTVGTRFAYFSPRRIYLRYSIFKSVQFSWADVNDVQLEDEFLEIGLQKGKDIRLVPSYKHTQHLRSYLDEIWKKARKKGKAPVVPSREFVPKDTVAAH